MLRISRFRALPTLLAAALLAACDGADDTPPPLDACGLFSVDIASLLGTAPFNAPIATTSGSTSSCQWVPTHPQSTDVGTFARFERISKAAFLKNECTAPKDTSNGNWTTKPLDGIGDAACEVDLGLDSIVSVQAHTPSGFAIQVGNATRSKDIEAINLLIAKLPQ